MHRLPTSRVALWKEIWMLAWPIAGTNFLLRGAMIVDTAMIGRIGAAALAGVGIAHVTVFISMAVERGLGIGGQILIAYHTGAKEPERRLKVARAVVALSLLVGIAVAGILMLVAPTLSRWMGANEEMLAQTLRFLNVYYWVFIFSGMFYVFSAIFQGAGDTKTPLYVTLGVNACHILLSYIFIFGKLGVPSQGVAGAAWALGISECLGTITLATLATRRGLWSPGIRGLSWGATKAVSRLGGPTVFERLIVNGMQGVFTRLVTGFGTAAFAAHRIGVDMEAFAFLPALGFGQAATTAVGQHLGAGNPDSARRAGWVTAQMSVIFMGLLGLSYFVFAEQWMRLFTPDQAVIAYGVRFCKVAACIQVPLAFALTIAGALRGAGETRWVMTMPLVGGWLVRLPLGYLLGYVLGFGIMGVWWTMFIDWFIRGSLISLKFRFMKFRLGEKVRLAPKPPPVVATREVGG